MYFKRKVYDQLLEGARRVGKSTIAENFAKNEYKSYILIDFSIASNEILDCFSDLSNLNLFFLELQAITGIDLYIQESVLIFDEIQLYPKARQAIKHLVKDGRYHYIETGSLISIKKNVKDILIPSEEMKIQVYPMDYEEFCNAVGVSYQSIKSLYSLKTSVGQSVNRKLLRDLRIYMAVGGMPQAVEAYVNGNNFSMIDQVKRQIIQLYEEDFKKLDPSGRLSSLFHSIPAQLAKGVKKYRISTATGKRKSKKDDELLFDLIDSKTVLPCFNVSDPSSSLSSSKDTDSFKLYIADTGLFVTLMFIDRPVAENDIYAKLLSDKLSINLGYLYENLAAQSLAAKNRDLYYHTWEKDNSTHYYEIDFIISRGTKLDVLEIKSSSLGKHESINEFSKKYSQFVGNKYIFSPKDYDKQNDIICLPIYFISLI